MTILSCHALGASENFTNTMLAFCTISEDFEYKKCKFQFKSPYKQEQQSLVRLVCVFLGVVRRIKENDLDPVVAPFMHLTDAIAKIKL